jgi:hypothetical protein
MTDLQPTATIAELIQKAKAVPVKNPRVFLATDNDAALVELRNAFPDTVTIPKVKLPIPVQLGRHYFASRTNRPDMAEEIARESVLDMVLLSRCEYLIAQANSSFSRISAVLKGDPSKTMYW